MNKILLTLVLTASAFGQSPTTSPANASTARAAQPPVVAQVTDKQLAEFWRAQAEALQAQVAIWKTKAEALESAAMEGPLKHMSETVTAMKQACGGQLGTDKNGNPVCPPPAAAAATK